MRKSYTLASELKVYKDVGRSKRSLKGLLAACDGYGIYAYNIYIYMYIYYIYIYIIYR